MKELYKNIIVKAVNMCSKKHMGMQEENNNICLKCDDDNLKNEQDFNIEEWVDYGLCGKCNKFKLCFDKEVFIFYKLRFNFKIENFDKLKNPLLRGFTSIGEYIDAKPFISMDTIASNAKKVHKDNINPIKNIDICRNYVHNYNYLFHDYDKKRDFEVRLLNYFKIHDIKSQKIEVNNNFNELVMTRKDLNIIMKQAKQNIHYLSTIKCLEELVKNITQKELNDDLLLRLFLRTLEFTSKFWITNNDSNIENKYKNILIIEGFFLDQHALSKPSGQLFEMLLRENRKTSSGIIFINEKGNFFF
jgi:hypothetical protein